MVGSDLELQVRQYNINFLGSSHAMPALTARFIWHRAPLESPSVLSSHSRFNTFLLYYHHIRPRLFLSFSRSLAGATRTPNQSRQSASRISKSSSANYLNPRTSYTRLLAARRSPTLLYQAPTTFAYPFACISIGSFCFAYGFYNFYDTFMIPHPGLPSFTPILMFLACSFMLGVGTLIGRNGFKLVKSITFVPGASQHDDMVRVQLRALRSLVGRSKEIKVSIADVKMPESFAEAIGESMPGEMLQRHPGTEAGRRQALVDGKKQARESYLDYISNPFKPIMNFMGRGGIGIKRIAMRDGFLNIQLRNDSRQKMKAYRMDARDGWFLDDGIALERLFLG